MSDILTFPTRGTAPIDQAPASTTETTCDGHLLVALINLHQALDTMTLYARNVPPAVICSVAACKVQANMVLANMGVTHVR